MIGRPKWNQILSFGWSVSQGLMCTAKSFSFPFKLHTLFGEFKVGGKSCLGNPERSTVPVNALVWLAFLSLMSQEILITHTTQRNSHQLYFNHLIGRFLPLCQFMILLLEYHIVTTFVNFGQHSSPLLLQIWSCSW